MIRSIVTDQVKAPLVVRNWLDLAGEKVDACWRLRFIRMANVKEAIFSDTTATLLPHATNFSFAFLVQMTGASHAVIFIALKLVQAVSGSFIRHNILKRQKVDHLKLEFKLH